MVTTPSSPTRPTSEPLGVPQRPTYAVVDLDAITGNIEAIDDHVGPSTAVMPVLKADAYGHGLTAVARHLEGEGVQQIGVAYVEEGIEARAAGFSGTILVLGGAFESQIDAFLDHGLTLTVPSHDKLQQVAERGRRRGVTPSVHLKIDTGMERIGVHHYNASAFIERAMERDDVIVDGVFSHFANADAADLGDARRQLERFLGVTDVLRSGSRRPLLHMANSAAVAQLPESHLDLVRPGILIYGVYPSRDTSRTIEVTPALEWCSTVIYFKVVEAGAAVSYGSSWVADEQTRMITLPVGYGDGYPRHASNRAQVLVGGSRSPVVGRVCMDQTMVDIGWESAYNGDPVKLIGAMDGDSITAEELADWADTIPYEVLTRITTRVPRVTVSAKA